MLFLAVFAAGLVAMTSQFKWISRLFTGEVTFQTVFLILLARVLADPKLSGAESAQHGHRTDCHPIARS